MTKFCRPSALNLTREIDKITKTMTLETRTNVWHKSWHPRTPCRVLGHQKSNRFGRLDRDTAKLYPSDSQEEERTRRDALAPDP